MKVKGGISSVAVTLESHMPEDAAKKFCLRKRYVVDALMPPMFLFGTFSLRQRKSTFKAKRK